MSRAGAGVLHSCDAAGCTAVAFTADERTPADWTRTEAAGEGMEHTARSRIGLDLCPAHPAWLGRHAPVLPGVARLRFETGPPHLTQHLACAGCDFSAVVTLPTGTAEDRAAALATAWLDHLTLASASVGAGATSVSEAT